MTNLPQVSALVDISVPKHVKVTTAPNLDLLMAEIGRKTMAGHSGQAMFGTAFVQGGRLQFASAIPVKTMLDISKFDQAKKRSNVEELMQHANRPMEKKHAKALRDYLMKTACAGIKFILPSFTFNYGVDLSDDDPVATLVLLASADDSVNAWPGLFMLPVGARVETTDGVHRRSQIEDIFKSSKATDDQKDALAGNAVDVKIVFEDSRNDSHQDFADCARAKTIAKSMVTTYDVREQVNKRTVELVKAVPFLKAYVDATASNVNLTAKSRKIWSMSAVRTCVAHINEDPSSKEFPTIEERTEGLEALMQALVAELPTLKALDRVKNDVSPDPSTASLREAHGGSVLLRGIGMSLIARMYLYCSEHEMQYEDLAKKLKNINWNILISKERADLPKDATYRDKLLEYANPLWASLLVIGEGRYKISSSRHDASNAWARIIAQMAEHKRTRSAA